MDVRSHSGAGRRWAWAAVALLMVVGPGRASAAPQEATPAVTAGAADGGGAAGEGLYIPDVSRLLPAARDPQALSATLQIFVLMTVLAVLPSIVLMTTSFVRMLVVLVLLRQALGTQTLPPTQVLVALALFMTMLVMAPRWQRVHVEAIDPYLKGQTSQLEAIDRAAAEMRRFMFDQIEAAGNEEDVYMMYEYAAQRSVEPTEVLTREQVPLTALLPAFLLSELKTAFIIGFRVYLPFLVIDMVIATILVAMGMMMLPPVLISLPFKLLLFVLADGWHLVAGALMASVVM
jgi:flagellar biosynthetic protein FliP